ncbi:MAG: AAA family ATPase [Bryobacteraceae bacterium]
MYPLTVGLIVETKELWDELQQAMEGLPIRVVFELSQLPTEWPPFLERLDRVRPDVVLLEVTNVGGQLEEIVKRIRSTAAQPAIFALHSTAHPEDILSALRAGAREYLYPPVGTPLRAAFQKLSDERSQARQSTTRGGKTFGFVSAKGGCGATTIACHVSAELARVTSRRVLLADFDLQTGMVGFLTKAKSPYSLADAVNNLQRLDQSYWQGLVSNGIPNLEIITAPASPAAKQLPANHLKQVLAFARTQYDFITLDLGRNLNPTTLALLDLIDEAFLITTQEVPALHHAKLMIQVLIEAGYPREKLRLVLNRSTRRFDVTIEELEKMLGVPVYATIANNYHVLHEAISEGQLVDGSSEVGEDMARLASKLGGVVEPPPKKRKFSLFG